MATVSRRIEIIEKVMSESVKSGIIHQTASDDSFDGRTIHIQDKKLINFGLCSYLGLEQDKRLKQGVINAVERYGTQFASSRSYVSVPLYAELEELFQTLFDGYCVITPTTTLGHISALPILIQETDIIILDQYVHNSVKTAVQILQNDKIPVEILSHNSVDELENKIQILKQKYRHIWYLADGVYSMFGDLAPLEKLSELLRRYEQFHIYIDDAHGMSWRGKHGRGYVLDNTQNPERIVVATSLNKAFSAAGGVIVFPDKKSANLVKTCGGPMIFSGPIQPPMLGAAITSARIHLDSEITYLQNELKERIEFCNLLIKNHNLPIIDYNFSPIFFIKLGSTLAAIRMVKKLTEEGFYVNGSTFPAVSKKDAGIRFTVTRHLSFDDISNLIMVIANNLEECISFSKKISA